jgi:hypothetical protein
MRREYTLNLNRSLLIKALAIAGTPIKPDPYVKYFENDPIITQCEFSSYDRNCGMCLCSIAKGINNPLRIPFYVLCLCPIALCKACGPNNSMANGSHLFLREKTLLYRLDAGTKLTSNSPSVACPLITNTVTELVPLELCIPLDDDAVEISYVPMSCDYVYNAITIMQGGKFVASMDAPDNSVALSFVSAVRAQQAHVRGVKNSIPATLVTEHDALLKEIGTAQSFATIGKQMVTALVNSPEGMSRVMGYGVVCDGCKNNVALKKKSMEKGFVTGEGMIIHGLRYRSRRVADYDLCQSCFETQTFESTHGPFASCEILPHRCDACQKFPELGKESLRQGYMDAQFLTIIGTRYTSQPVFNFDLCVACKNSGRFDISHSPFTVYSMDGGSENQQQQSPGVPVQVAVAVEINDGTTGSGVNTTTTVVKRTTPNSPQEIAQWLTDVDLTVLIPKFVSEQINDAKSLNALVPLSIADLKSVLDISSGAIVARLKGELEKLVVV